MKLTWANYPVLVKRSKRVGSISLIIGTVGLILLLIPATQGISMTLLILALLSIAYEVGLIDADSIIYKSQHDVNRTAPEKP